MLFNQQDISKQKIETMIISLKDPNVVVKYVEDDMFKTLGAFKKNKYGVMMKKPYFTIQHRVVYDALGFVRNFGLNYNGKPVRTVGTKQWKISYKLWKLCEQREQGHNVKLSVFPYVVKAKIRSIFDRGVHNM